MPGVVSRVTVILFLSNSVSARTMASVVASWVRSLSERSTSLRYCTRQGRFALLASTQTTILVDYDELLRLPAPEYCLATTISCALDVDGLDRAWPSPVAAGSSCS
jgi:hypothetical protein